jgi:pSer/pThr/pTyr-binding forkhead associated (FHA) protein
MPRVLITIPDGPPQPYRFDLSRRSVSLGRGADNDIVIDSGSVSLKHAEMIRNDDGYELRDLGSTNGLKFEGERRMSVPLESGTTVLIGDVAFDFQLSEEETSELTGIPVAAIIEEDDADEDAPAVVIVTERGGGIWWLIGLIIVLLAFLVGFSIRHQKVTGKSLIDEWFKKPVPAATPAQ